MTERLIQVENLNAVKKMVRTLPAEAKQAVKQYNVDMAKEIAGYTPAYTPELSGRLLRSLKAGADGNGGYVSSGTGARTQYAPVIHWGWPSRGIPRTGYLVRGMSAAGRAHDGDIANYYVDGLIKVIDDAMSEM